MMMLWHKGEDGMMNRERERMHDMYYRVACMCTSMIAKTGKCCCMRVSLHDFLPAAGVATFLVWLVPWNKIVKWRRLQRKSIIVRRRTQGARSPSVVPRRTKEAATETNGGEVQRTDQGQEGEGQEVHKSQA